jgi:hypothetical protein
MIKLEKILLSNVLGVFEPLQCLGDEEGFRQTLDSLGWDCDALGITDPSSFSAPVQSLTDASQDIENLLEQDDIDFGILTSSLVKLALAVAGVIKQFASLDLPPGAPTSLPEQLSSDLAAFVVENYLETTWPWVAFGLECAGIYKSVDWPDLPENASVNGATLFRRASTHKQIDLAAISNFVKNPLSYWQQQFLTDASGQMRPAADIADSLGPILAEGISRTGLLAAGYGILPEAHPALTAAQQELAKRLLIISGTYPVAEDANAYLRIAASLVDQANALALFLIASGEIAIALDTAIGTFTLDLSGASQPLVITANSVSLAKDSTDANLAFQVKFKTAAATVPAIRLGPENGTHLQIDGIQAALAWQVDAEGIDVGGSLDLTKVLLAIQGGDGDSFISSLLPKSPIEVHADLGVDASLRKGIRFRGSAGFEITIPINQSILGVITIQSLDLALQAKSDRLQASLAVSCGAELGPLSVTVDKIGLIFKFMFAGGGGFDPQIGFKPPDGAGFSIDASSVKGGGYLMFDTDNEQYAGALELSIQDKFSLTAIGVLTTKMPDGSKGFSLLIIISCNFPPIALGYGFFLNGVGGMLGLNRTMQVDVMRQGVQQGTVDELMFPHDIIKNIARIISDIQAIFTPAKDQFIIGPFAEIVWCNPPIISVKLGLVIEFSSPFRINILGVLRVALPPGSDEVLVQIQVNFFGCIDFNKGYLTFDASLFDSFLGYSDYKFSLAGDMALRIFWGDQKEFLASVGGFHPAFKPSASLLLPAKMTRLTLSLLSGNPHLTLTTYFALTSNTVQFGAAIDFYLSISSFKVTGYFGFDVLFQFSPFYFTAEIAARLAVEMGGTVLLGIGLDFQLQGPSPWHAKGTAEFKVLFISYHADFDKTFGEEQNSSLPEIEVLPQLLEAFRQPSNWRNDFKATPGTMVSLRQLDDDPDLVILHGHDRLSCHQTVLPLDTEIDLFGQSKPRDIKRAVVDSVALGAKTLSANPIQDLFSPALFKVMSDDDKLKAPSFAPMWSGMQADDEEGVSAHAGRDRQVDYDVVISDVAPASGSSTASAPRFHGSLPMLKNRFLPFVQRRPGRAKFVAAGAVGTGGAAVTPVKVVEESYVVVFNDTLKPCSDLFTRGMRWQADDALRRMLKDHPEWQGRIQIVAEFQAAGG